jgi:hypothetical protein
LAARHLTGMITRRRLSTARWRRPEAIVGMQMYATVAQDPYEDWRRSVVEEAVRAVEARARCGAT